MGSPCLEHWKKGQELLRTRIPPVDISCISVYGQVDRREGRVVCEDSPALFVVVNVAGVDTRDPDSTTEKGGRHRGILSLDIT